MNWKSKLLLGVLTALAMMLLTYALPRGGAIFVLLFVKLK
jgi:hypothetical protein